MLTLTAKQHAIVSIATVRHPYVFHYAKSVPYYFLKAVYRNGFNEHEKQQQLRNRANMSRDSVVLQDRDRPPELTSILILNVKREKERTFLVLVLCS